MSLISKLFRQRKTRYNPTPDDLTILESGAVMVEGPDDKKHEELAIGAKLTYMHQNKDDVVLEGRRTILSTLQKKVDFAAIFATFLRTA